MLARFIRRETINHLQTIIVETQKVITGTKLKTEHTEDKNLQVVTTEIGTRGKKQDITIDTPAGFGMSVGGKLILSQITINYEVNVY